LISFSFWFFFFSMSIVVNLLILKKRNGVNFYTAQVNYLSTLIIPIPLYVAKNHLEYQAQGLLKLIVLATIV
jgi:hypothetical protein